MAVEASAATYSMYHSETKGFTTRVHF